MGHSRVSEEVKIRDRDTETRTRSDRRSNPASKSDAGLIDDSEFVRGSGNPFADLGYPDADIQHVKALLAARVIIYLDAAKLTVRAAEEATGIAAADFSRIRRAKLDRFTIDRLIAILNRLGQRVDVTIRVTPKAA